MKGDMTSHQMMEAIEDRDQIPQIIVSRLDSGLVTSRDVNPRLVLADSWLSFGKSVGLIAPIVLINESEGFPGML
jgi:hypothetical protein